jgi:hypothetical protein
MYIAPCHVRHLVELSALLRIGKHPKNNSAEGLAWFGAEALKGRFRNGIDRSSRCAES